MATQILMPALSPTMTEGKLSRWLKSVGDMIRAGDVIAEIETDKATMEVEAVDEGRLSAILEFPRFAYGCHNCAGGDGAGAGDIRQSAAGFILAMPQVDLFLQFIDPTIHLFQIICQAC